MSDLLAIDVGSSRIKLGWFPEAAACVSKPSSELAIAEPRLVEPAEMIAVVHRDRAASEWREEMRQRLDDELGLAAAGEVRCVAASVHPGVLSEVQACLNQIGYPEIECLAGTELPLEIRVEQPQRVGVDRLLNGLAAVLRNVGDAIPTIIVDAGTAIKVDLAGPSSQAGCVGAFAGGAIMPGVKLSSLALHTGTAALPEVGFASFSEPPHPLGKSTEQAIAAGLYWGSVGAVRELATRLACEFSNPPILVTGGDGERFAGHLQDDPTAAYGTVRYLRSLTLSGIWAAAQS